MSKQKSLFRIITHLSFWGGFMAINMLQNPDEGLKGFISFGGVLLLSAIVVYFNLYLLFPKFFFKGKYVLYTIFLFLNIMVGATIITLAINGQQPIGNVPVLLQNVINLIFIVVITGTLKFYRENQNKQNQIIVLENLKLQTELSLLKSEINPHFFFNSLNNLYGLILQEKNKMAADTVLKLSELMRYILEINKIEKVNLKEEINFINNYLELEKIRLSQNADIQFEVSLSHENLELPPLLFIPMVENAF